MFLLGDSCYFAILNTCLKCLKIATYKAVHLRCGPGHLFLAVSATTLQRATLWNSLDRFLSAFHFSLCIIYPKIHKYLRK